MNVVLDYRTVLSSQVVLSAIVVSLLDLLLPMFATRHMIWRVPDSEDAKVMATGVEVLHSVLKVSEIIAGVKCHSRVQYSH